MTPARLPARRPSLSVRPRGRERQHAAHGIGELRRARAPRAACRPSRTRRSPRPPRSTAPACDGRPATREPARRDDRRRQPRRTGAERDQRVHVGTACRTARTAARAGSACPDRRRRACRARAARSPRGALEEPVRHRDHEQRHRRGDRDRRVAPQPGCLVDVRALDRVRASSGRVRAHRARPPGRRSPPRGSPPPTLADDACSGSSSIRARDSGRLISARRDARHRRARPSRRAARRRRTSSRGPAGRARRVGHSV